MEAEESDIYPVLEPVEECVAMCRLISKLQDLFTDVEKPYIDQITQIAANYSRFSTSSPLVRAFAGVSAQADAHTNKVHLARTDHYGQGADDESTDPSMEDDTNVPYTSNPFVHDEAKESLSHDDDEDEQNSTTRVTKRPRRGGSVDDSMPAASLGTYSVSNSLGSLGHPIGDFDIVKFVGELEGSQYNRLTVDWSCDWKRCCIPGLHSYYCEYAGCGRRVHRDCTIHWANENRVAVTLDNYCMEHHPQYQDWMAQKLPARPN